MKQAVVATFWGKTFMLVLEYDWVVSGLLIPHIFITKLISTLKSNFLSAA
jgi:hypothetical protein